jgi:hypothetical protein
VRGQIFIVGGAAMALAYSTRRVTKDIDAVFEPKSAIYDAAATVADELGLPEDWLNDAAKRYMPGNDEHPRAVADIHGIEVTTASARYLLAMKLMAMRFGEDDDDIAILLRECGMHSPRRRSTCSNSCTRFETRRRRRDSSSKSCSARKNGCRQAEDPLP